VNAPATYTEADKNKELTLFNSDVDLVQDFDCAIGLGGVVDL
jgi:hypothetical protein